MALLQYFYQRIFLIFNPADLFSEWRLYLCYQMVAVIALLAILEAMDLPKAANNLVAFVCLALLPLVTYEGFFEELYIDPMLGLLTGAAFTIIALGYRHSVYNILQIATLCFLLVLMKDAGLLFAICFAICLIVCDIVEHARNRKTTPWWIRPASLFPLIASLIAKATWSWHLTTSNTDVRFGGKIDLAQFASLLFTHSGTDWKQGAADSFRQAFFTQGVVLGATGITITYFSLFLLGALTLVFVSHAHVVHDDRYPTNAIVPVSICIIATTALYVFGLGATYISNFSEYEAARLASYQRYMDIAYLALMLFIASVAMRTFVLQSEQPIRFCNKLLVVFIVLCVATPMVRLSDFVSRQSVRNSINIRQPFSKISNTITQAVPPNSHVYFISQESDGFDYYITRFAARPAAVSDAWSIGQPFYEGDIWTKSVSADELRNTLMVDYDYLAIYKTNSYFKDHYAELFSDPKEITNNTLYVVDKATGTLRPYASDSQS